jgi:hypothetical protein
MLSVVYAEVSLMPSVKIKPFMLSVNMLNVILLRVIVPFLSFSRKIKTAMPNKNYFKFILIITHVQTFQISCLNYCFIPGLTEK